MSVSGLPVGVQVMGQQHEDARMTSLARWLLESIAPIVVP
jgi:Asp-tRNA(Asn)/Glu-tRNA(Gln) amidotransferase A subunit family amidase